MLPFLIGGPYITGSGKNKGRRHVTVEYGTIKRTISFARYLMEMHLRRKLLDNEDVHHIDEDKTNDSLTNLEVLTKDEHVDAHHVGRKDTYTVKCLLCDKDKILTYKQYQRLHYDMRKGHSGTYCNYLCRNRYTNQFKDYKAEDHGRKKK